MLDKLHILFSKRMIIVLIFGFASGLPLGLTASCLQAWYAVENVDIVTIGFLGLVGQPYAYKFLWSPVMDKFSLKGNRRRGWIVVCQIALIALLLVMSTLDPSQAPVAL